jgi:hypothetical protein
MMARRKNRPEIPRHEIGPTQERISHSQGAFVVGGDDSVGRVYQFLDTPLDRLYSRLARGAGTRETADLQTEYTALRKYRHHWHQAGLEASLPSVDPGRAFASDPSNFSGMAKSERQYDHRAKFRQAREILGHRVGIVIDNVICAEQTLEIAGFSIGYASPFRARKAATEMVRDAGYRLAGLWGIG